MTALKEYDRLESTGLWRDTSDAQRRDVGVSFGQASLIISGKDGAPLTHWSLAAVERINPGEHPAIYRPGSDSGETLEIEDREITEAIERVRRAIARRRPHHGRLRLAIFVLILAVITGLALLWLPDALTRHAVKVVPASKRVEIGGDLLDHIKRLTGEPCGSPRGDAALSKLRARALGENRHSVYIVPDGAWPTLSLPGQILLLDRTLIEDFETPEVVAGYMAAAAQNAHLPDPLENLLNFGGLSASLKLLTTGSIDDAILKRYAQVILTSPQTPASDATLIKTFTEAKLPLGPYAYAVDVTGEQTVALIEADPYRSTPVPRLLSDDDWVSLQGICGA